MKTFTFELTVKDYLVREAKVLGRMDIVDNEENISHVRFNKEFPRYTFKINGETIYFNVPKWKEISVNTNYEVSRFGQVRRKSSKKVLAYSKTPYCKLPLGNHKSVYSIHRLVVIAFIGYDKNVTRTDVNHHNLNVEDNNLFNLYWVTRRENIIHYKTIRDLLFDYDNSIGKELQTKDGKAIVVGFNRDTYKLVVEFENTGNQKEIRTHSLETGRPTDNFYILISPEGKEISTRSLTILKESHGIIGARFSEMLNDGRESYKGWTIKRDTNNKIIGGNANGKS